jgi:hypothetical protein
MASKYSVQVGRWRVAVTDDGGTFQWREPFFSAGDAHAAVERARGEYPDATVSVEELRADGVGDDASAAKWFEVKE